MDLKDFLGMNLVEARQTPFVESFGLPVSAELIGSEFYMSIPDAGIEFNANFDRSITSVQLFSEGVDDYRAYTRELPEGLEFSLSRPEVLSKLGRPSHSGGGGPSLLYDKVPWWDRFLRDGYSIHVQYEDDEQSIRIVSLIRADAVPQ